MARPTTHDPRPTPPPGLGLPAARTPVAVPQPRSQPDQTADAAEAERPVRSAAGPASVGNVLGQVFNREPESVRRAGAAGTAGPEQAPAAWHSVAAASYPDRRDGRIWPATPRPRRRTCSYGRRGYEVRLMLTWRWREPIPRRCRQWTLIKSRPRMGRCRPECGKGGRGGCSYGGGGGGMPKGAGADFRGRR